MFQVLRGYFDTPASFFRSVPNFIGNALGLNRAAEQAAQQDALEKAAAAKRNIQQYTGGGGGGGGRGNIGSDGADYSGSAQTGAKGGFGYGL